jgi:drug/metabolite transporter (DMT)-like permease
MAILARGAYSAGVTVPTLLVGRFVIAAAAFWTLLAITRTLMPSRRTSGKALAVGAVVYAAQAAMFFVAVSRLSATLAALLLYTYPFMVFVAGVARGHERATRDRVLPLAVAGVGVAIVLSAGGGPGALDPIGVAAALGAAVVYTVYLLAAKQVTADAEPIAASALVMTGAAGVTAVAATATGDLDTNFAASGWLWLAVLALGATVVGVWALIAGLQRVSSTNASIVSTSEPVITVGLAIALLGETLAPLQLAGAAAVLSSVYLLQRAEPVSLSDDVPAAEAADCPSAGSLAHESA